MKVNVLNVQHIHQTDAGYDVEFSPGQIEFQTKDKIFALAAPFTFKLNLDYRFVALRSNAVMNVFKPDGIEVIESGMIWNVLSMLQVDDFSLEKHIIQLIKEKYRGN